MTATAKLEPPHIPGTISENTYRCWALDHQIGEMEWHERDEGSARTEAARVAEEYDVPVPAIRQRDTACFEVHCGCDYQYDEDESTGIHFDSEAEARAAVTGDGWSDDLRCPGCRDDAADLAAAKSGTVA